MLSAGKTITYAVYTPTTVTTCPQSYLPLRAVLKGNQTVYNTLQRVLMTQRVLYRSVYMTIILI